MNDFFGKKDDEKKGVMATDNTLSKSVVKPKTRRGKKETVKKKEAVSQPSSQSAEVQRVPVTSLVLGRLIIKDAPSGEIYTFERAGAELPVRVQDIQHFRSKNREETAGKCCSSGGNKFMRKYFEIPK